MGMTCSCTGVGWVNWRSCTASKSSGANPNLAKPLGTATTCATGAAVSASLANVGIEVLKKSSERESWGDKSPFTSKVSVMVCSRTCQRNLRNGFVNGQRKHQPSNEVLSQMNRPGWLL